MPRSLRRQRGYITAAQLGIGRQVAAEGGDPHFASVVLLALNENNLDAETWFRDYGPFSGRHTLIPVGNAQWDTAQAPTGLTSSGLFDGIVDEITVASHADFAFGTGDFTLELWARANTTVIDTILDFRPMSANGPYPTLYIDAGVWHYLVNSVDRITGGTVNAGVWYYLAVSRSGTATRLFVNGVQVGSTWTY